MAVSDISDGKCIYGKKQDNCCYGESMNYILEKLKRTLIFAMQIEHNRDRVIPQTKFLF